MIGKVSRWVKKRELHATETALRHMERHPWALARAGPEYDALQRKAQRLRNELGYP